LIRQIVRSSLTIITTHRSAKIKSRRPAMFVRYLFAPGATIPILTFDRPPGQKFVRRSPPIPLTIFCGKSIDMHRSACAEALIKNYCVGNSHSVEVT
jgi:hypothetical protein